MTENRPCFAESPRIAPVVDLSRRRRYVAGVTVTGASPRRVQSLRGHTACGIAAEGFPRHYPSAYVSSLVETAGVGFAVMSGFSHGITPMQGKFLPDKEFRYLRHSCYHSTWGSFTSHKRG